MRSKIIHHDVHAPKRGLYLFRTVGHVCRLLMAKGWVSGILQGSPLIFSALSLQLAGYFYHGTFQNIGIIIAGFIFMTVVTFFVIKNQELMKFSKS